MNRFPRGVIHLDDESAKLIGFTSDKFSDYSYLWNTGRSIYISIIGTTKKGNGDFRKLVQNILRYGYDVRIPTPLGKMLYLVQKNGYVKTKAWDENNECYTEIWVLYSKSL
jgi:hypothetical protein